MTINTYIWHINGATSILLYFEVPGTSEISPQYYQNCL